MCKKLPALMLIILLVCTSCSSKEVASVQHRDISIVSRIETVKGGKSKYEIKFRDDTSLEEFTKTNSKSWKNTRDRQSVLMYIWEYTDGTKEYRWDTNPKFDTLNREE